MDGWKRFSLETHPACMSLAQGGRKATPPTHSFVFNILFNIFSIHHHLIMAPSRTSGQFCMSTTRLLYLAVSSLKCHFPSVFNSLLLPYFLSASLSQCFVPSPCTCLRVVLTFSLFISSTGTTICGWNWPQWIVPQARSHVIIIQSSIRSVEKDCQDHNYTSFTLGLQSCRGKQTQIPHPGSVLGRWNKTKGKWRAHAGMSLLIKICQWRTSTGQKVARREGGRDKGSEKA